MKTFAALGFAALCTAAVAGPAPTDARMGAGVDTGGVLGRLGACRGAAGEGDQLTCYRQAAQALLEAEAAGDILIVSREDAQAARRQAFGLSLPSGSVVSKSGAEDDLHAFVGEVRAARQDATGRWILQLDGGATWAQSDTTPLRKPPEPGASVTVIRAALGSYKLKVGDQPAVRATRVR